MPIPLPVHPQPSFYETTKVAVWPDGEGQVITHKEVEEILARPKWDFATANREAQAKVNVEVIAAKAAAKKTAAKKASAKKRTPPKKNPS